MKVLAWAASNSRQSINKALVTHASNVLREHVVLDAEVEILDINDYEMPLFSIDRENENGIPQLAHQLYSKIGAADALLISYAEHNGHYTAAYKNLFDWVSRIDSKVYQDKPAVLLSASPGAGGASSVLAAAKTSAPYFGAIVKSQLSVPRFNENFDLETGKLKNTELQAQLKSALTTLT